MPHRMMLPWRRPDAGPVIERYQATRMMPGRVLPAGTGIGTGPSGTAARLSHARAEPASLRPRICRASWRLRPFWREAADLQQMPCSATGTDTRSLRARVIGRRAIGIFKAFGLIDRGRVVEQQERAHARGLLAPGWMP